MARDGGYTSPENMVMILEVVRYLKRNGFVISGKRETNQFVPPEAPIYIRNDTGETIPAFGCVQCTGTVEQGGQNYITVGKPFDSTGAAGAFLFNSIAPIGTGDDSKYGIAYGGPLARMLTDGSTVICGGSWQPEVGEFAIVPGGSMFTAIGEDDIATDVMRGFFRASTGMYLYTLTSATVGNIRNMADTVAIATGVTVVNTLNMFGDQVAGDRGVCCLDGGVYYRIAGPCKV